MDLFSINPPYFALLVGEKKEFGHYVYKLNSDFRYKPSCAGELELAIRVIRGTKMRCENDLHDEISAAFQFPYYFGENWGALHECLRDLDWIPVKGYAIMISDTPAVLRDYYPDRLAIFVEILADTCKYSATQHQDFPSEDLKPVPFHVLFHCAESDLDFVRAFVGSDTPVLFLAKVQDTAD